MTECTRGRVRLEACETHDLLALTGVIDIELARELHAAVCEMSRSGRDGVVDAADAEYLDASALQLLLALRSRLTGAGRTLRIAAISEAARDCCARGAVWADLAGDAR